MSLSVASNNGSLIPAGAQAASQINYETLEKVLVQGDLKDLKPKERVEYLMKLCQSLGLNALSKPIEFMDLSGKLVPYVKKDATEQIRRNNNVSLKIVSRELLSDDLYVVTARATTPDGRTDESTGVVCLSKEGGEWTDSGSKGPDGKAKRFFKKNGKMVPLTGEEKANALMKAETKSKRRVTLSICGLGFIDESEAYDIPGAKRFIEKTPEQEEAEINLMLSFHLAAINGAKSMEELKKTFGAAHKSELKKYPEHYDMLVLQKDRRKEELEIELKKGCDEFVREMDEEPAPKKNKGLGRIYNPEGPDNLSQAVESGIQEGIY